MAKRKKAKTKIPAQRHCQFMETKSADSEPRNQAEIKTQLTSNVAPQPHDEAKTASGALRLLPFPPEIRHIIYNLVLDVSSNDPKYGRALVARCQKVPTPKKDFNLSIILVSRQTYVEAYHIFYRINQLRFANTTDLFQFLYRIGHIRRQHLVSISFSHWDGNAKRAFRLLKTCPSLKRIRLTVPYHQPPGYVALREVRGLESVHIDFDESREHQRQPMSNLDELKKAMMRPRLQRYEIDPEAKIDLFKKHPEVYPKNEKEKLAVEMKWPTKVGCSCYECPDSAN